MASINVDFIRRFELGFSRIDPKFYGLFMGWLPFCGIVADSLLNAGLASEAFTLFFALVVSGPFYVCSISLLADDVANSSGYTWTRTLFGTMIVFGLLVAHKVRKQLILTIICCSMVIGLVMMIKIFQERTPRLMERLKQRR